MSHINQANAAKSRTIQTRELYSLTVAMLHRLNSWC